MTTTLRLIEHAPKPADYDRYHPDRPLGGRVSRDVDPGSLAGGRLPYFYVTGQSAVLFTRDHSFGRIDVQPPRPAALNGGA